MIRSACNCLHAQRLRLSAHRDWLNRCQAHRCLHSFSTLSAAGCVSLLLLLLLSVFDIKVSVAQEPMGRRREQVPIEDVACDEDREWTGVSRECRARGIAIACSCTPSTSSESHAAMTSSLRSFAHCLLSRHRASTTAASSVSVLHRFHMHPSSSHPFVADALTPLARIHPWRVR